MHRRAWLQSPLVIAGFLCGNLLLAADVSGDWRCIVTSPQGEHPATLQLTQAGEKISGAFRSDRGDFKIAGTVKGNDIHFTLAYSGGDAPSQIPFDGKVEGGKMAGQYQAGDVTGNWSAEKAP